MNSNPLIAKLETLIRIVLMMYLCTLSSDAYAQARQELNRGIKAYENESYTDALEAFRSAAELAPDESLDPALAVYNQGNVQYRSGQLQEAATLYEKAANTPNPRIQFAASHNRGTALMKMATSLKEAEKVDDAAKAVVSALESYETAIQLAPEKIAPKVNYELAVALREELEELQQQQQEQEKQQSDSDEEQENQEENDDSSSEDNQDDAGNQQDQQDQQQDDSEQQEEEQDGDQEEEQDKQPDDEGSEKQENGTDESEEEDESQPSQQPVAPPEEMSEEEAAMMLDAMKEEEQTQREKMRLRLGRPVKVDKDW